MPVLRIKKSIPPMLFIIIFSLLLVLFFHSIEREIPAFKISPVEYSEESRAEYNCDADAPVNFLEERLPLASPDPERTSYPVTEIDGSGDKKYDGIAVSDTSDSGLIITDEMKKEWSIGSEDISLPTVLIYHTHSCESFSSGFTGFYYADQSSRSTMRNISEPGEKLKAALESYGIGVIHDTTLYDSPEFEGAYARSMEGVQAYLEKYPSIRVTIDLHRDSMVASDGTSYKPSYSIKGKKAAQMMLLTGADPYGELDYKNWYPNLLFSLKIQQKAEELYPGLMRPMMFCQRKYNLDATDCSLLIELGTDANTFSEADYSAELIGDVLGRLISGK